ncbi:MAG: Fic family protein [Sphingobacteriales bacterium]|nr:MAG: Fic family protein [Sphingobacteriales bacterium]
MKPPYQITSTILKSITSVSEKLGSLNARYLDKPAPQLRKQNRIKTIHSSLQIEGNTLTEQQVTALLENKRVVGPQKDITEVLNAVKVYEQLSKFKPLSKKSFLSAHKILMNGLISDAGKYRRKGVGIVKGENVTHIAPPYANVPFLMTDLFNYLKSDEIALIKSCVFHYEMEFIHPFMDGNGRMGRLWQTVILLSEYPFFEYLPFETLISRGQDDYYTALSRSDKEGSSTTFIEYMLGIVDQSLTDALNHKLQLLKDTDRLVYFISKVKSVFTRKDYMEVFKDISTATASRDLKKGVEMDLFEKEGDKIKAVYKLKNN